MSETERVFSADELLLRFRCKCGIVTIVDAKTTSYNLVNPPACQSCHASLENFARLIIAYRQFIEQAATVDVRLTTSSHQGKESE
jgi:hypothetical protein